MKQTIKILSLVLLLVSALALVAAADSFCFYKMGSGQKFHITQTEYYTCAHTTCTQCVNSSMWVASWIKCKNACTTIGTGSDPNLTLSTIFPVANNGVYSKQSFTLNINTNVIASISIIDNIAGTEKNLCPNCKTYMRPAYFHEGLNDITIRAVKGAQIKENRIIFSIDSKKPYITKVFPLTNKYAKGTFTIFYSEDNLKSLKLKYGNNITGMREANLPLSTCPSGAKQNCSIDVNLASYEGQDISYLFVITDIANTNISSRLTTKVKIDRTAPVITYFNSTVSTKYLTLNMSITEKNFNKVEYMDNTDLIPRWKTVCSSLRYGACVKKLFFRTGSHDVDLRVTDKAGNEVQRSIPFDII